jgi:hypothetical protein
MLTHFCLTSRTILVRMDRRESLMSRRICDLLILQILNFASLQLFVLKSKFEGKSAWHTQIAGGLKAYSRFYSVFTGVLVLQ